MPTSVVEFSFKRTFGPGFDSLKQFGSSSGAAWAWFFPFKNLLCKSVFSQFQFYETLH
jgi:hypothetical protein